MKEHAHISEASRVAGVSPSTVRRWVRSGAISGTKNDNDEWLIDIQSLRNHIVQGASITPPPPVSLESESVKEHAAIHVLKQTIDDARMELREAKAKIDSLELQLDAAKRAERAAVAELMTYLRTDRERAISEQERRESDEFLNKPTRFTWLPWR